MYCLCVRYLFTRDKSALVKMSVVVCLSCNAGHCLGRLFELSEL